MNNNIKNVHFLTSKQVSKYLFIPLRTVQRLSKEGRIKGVKIGNQWRYKKADVENYISLGTNFSREPERRYSELIERRAFPRINSNLKCRYSVNIAPFKDTNNEAIIKNLSAGGAALIIQDKEINKIETGDPINLDFDLTKKTETLNIKTEGRIVRKQGAVAGIKFRDIDEETRNKIIQYIG